MATFDPDTLERDIGVLQRIQREFGGLIALNCSVAIEGRVSVGDPVTLLDEPVRTARTDKGGERADAGE